MKTIGEIMREDKTKYKVEGVLDDRLLVVRYVNAGSFLRAAGNAKDQGLSGIFSIEHMSAGVKLQGTDMVNQFLEDYRKEANEPAIQEVVQELEKQGALEENVSLVDVVNKHILDKQEYDNEEIERIKLEKGITMKDLLAVDLQEGNITMSYYLKVIGDIENHEGKRKLEKEMASTLLKERLIEQQYDNVYDKLKKSTTGCAYMNDGLLAETIERLRSAGFVVKAKESAGFVVKAKENDDESITYIVKTH